MAAPINSDPLHTDTAQNASTPMSTPKVNGTPPGYEDVADVRDGLNQRERVVLFVLHQTQKERGDRNVPTAMLWGRVCEHFYISPEELSEMLARLGARR
jgi:hypothetical protein